MTGKNNCLTHSNESSSLDILEHLLCKEKRHILHVVSWQLQRGRVPLKSNSIHLDCFVRFSKVWLEFHSSSKKVPPHKAKGDQQNESI